MTNRYRLPYGHTKHRWPSYTRIRKRRKARQDKLFQLAFKTKGLMHKDERFCFNDIYKGRQYLIVPGIGIYECKTDRLVKEL